MDEIEHLSNEMSKKLLQTVFGLEAQGHIPTIEKIIKEVSGEITISGKKKYVDMTYDEYTWQKIGKEIGWKPFTAALHYFNYLNKK